MNYIVRYLIDMLRAHWPVAELRKKARQHELRIESEVLNSILRRERAGMARELAVQRRSDPRWEPWGSVLSIKVVRELRREFMTGLPISYLAEKYDCVPLTIVNAIRGRTWKQPEAGYLGTFSNNADAMIAYYEASNDGAGGQHEPPR